MDSHINIAGVIHLILGGLQFLTGAAILILFLVLGGVGGVAAFQEGAGEALAVLGTMGALGIFVAGCVSVLGLPEMAAGYGLLKRKAWAPMLALIVSAFQVFNFPIGTALAAYSAWALLSKEGQDAYRLGASGRGMLR